jgi:hypothetical protein
MNPTTEHVLKVWPAYWDALKSGDKTFEVRRDDRGFQRGDILALRRWHVQSGAFMDDYECAIRKRVSYVLTGGQLGIAPGYVVMGLAEVENDNP